MLAQQPLSGGNAEGTPSQAPEPAQAFAIQMQQQEQQQQQQQPFGAFTGVIPDGSINSLAAQVSVTMFKTK